MSVTETMDVAEPLLSIQDLRVSFKGRNDWLEVLHGVSFDIDRCETVAVVGESGSGKSVSALSTMRLLPEETTKTTGRILFEGRDVLKLSPSETRRLRGNDIAMIFQEPMTSLNPVMTVGQQISETLIAHKGMGRKEAMAEAGRLLDRVHIPAANARLDNFPHEFSGGMRQRVMIAMALACRPSLLIADEPTTALDVTVQAQILDLIKEIQKEFSMSVLFITHDMGVVADIADRCVVMYQGEIEETGTVEKVFLDPQRPYTKALIAAVPRLGSMAGQAHPLPFPIVDRQSGETTPATPGSDTIDHKAGPVLEVRNLVKRFPIHSPFLRRVKARIHAVENVSFELFKGETLALVGESGSGKSTTGRTLMRLVEPNEGDIALAGRKIGHQGGKDLRGLRRDIQMIFQDPLASLNPRLRIRDAIAEPLTIHGLASREEGHAKAAELLEQVGLPAALGMRYPHELSGGQRQRICIARALALDPKVIVADEAVSSLDVSVKAQVINLMMDLQRRLGLSYLFISHDMAVVERISHRVAVMYLGEIIEIGPRAAIFEDARHPYTRKLLGAVLNPDPRYRRAPRADNSELKNPLRPADYVPPVPTYTEVTPGHFVRDADRAAGDSPLLAAEHHK